MDQGPGIDKTKSSVPDLCDVFIQQIAKDISSNPAIGEVVANSLDMSTSPINLQFQFNKYSPSEWFNPPENIEDMIMWDSHLECEI